MIVTIHQPEHLSYLGFWQKLLSADMIVFLDNVQYEKNYFQNRNRICTPNGAQYITVPVTNTTNPIKDVSIAKEYGIYGRRKILRSIKENYSKAPFFKGVYPMLERCYMYKHSSLRNLNLHLYMVIRDYLGISKPLVFASELGVSGSKTDLIVDICKKVGATKYIAGKSGMDYLELDKFDIPVEFQDFKHPIYPQHNSTIFIENMSIIDALFNLGKETINLINH